METPKRKEQNVPADGSALILYSWKCSFNFLSVPDTAASATQVVSLRKASSFGVMLVSSHNSSVALLVSFEKLWRHRKRIIEIWKGRLYKVLWHPVSSVRSPQFLSLWVCWSRPWKVVVVDILTVTVVAFQFFANSSHPWHMDVWL